MISVIVPIYNVENYLVACVDSILNSTYKDIELILVDDGSLDGCGAICDHYASNDSRVKVIHKENGGLSDARNAGLEITTGEYVAFIDGDDVVNPEMLEVLYSAIISGNYDLSMILGIMVDDKGVGYDYIANTQIPSETGLPKTISRYEFIKNLGDGGVEAYQYHVVWNKLFKRSIINGHLFRNVASEDVEWMNRVCLGVKQGILIDRGLYYYIQRNNSIIHTDVVERKSRRIKTYYTCLQETPSEMPECRAVMLKAIYSVIFDSRFASKGTKLHDSVDSQAKQIYKETKNELIHSQLSWARKLRILTFYHFPRLYDLVIRLRYGIS